VFEGILQIPCVLERRMRALPVPEIEVSYSKWAWGGPVSAGLGSGTESGLDQGSFRLDLAS